MRAILLLADLWFWRQAFGSTDLFNTVVIGKKDVFMMALRTPKIASSSVSYEHSCRPGNNSLLWWDEVGA